MFVVFPLLFSVYCLHCDLNALRYINIPRIKGYVHICGNKINTAPLPDY